VIVIVDYGMGNLGSIRNMLRKLGAEASVSGDPKAIEQASHLILPGVGAFTAGMQNLQSLGLIGVLQEKALSSRTPILGVCLGMQLMTADSEEGSIPGLGWVRARTVRFRLEDSALKVPHMGWNTVRARPGCPLFKAFDAEPRFYFVHSYHLSCEDAGLEAGTTHHGHDFASAIQQGNIFGVQFHPEKSHKFGLRLLRNFLEVGSPC
jgi:imidazole glycerol-phosphate synthase subunit HisH